MSPNDIVFMVVVFILIYLIFEDFKWQGPNISCVF